MDLLENYKQYKNNQNFINDDNFKENTKNLVFNILDKKDIDSKIDKKNVDYFSTEEVLEKLSKDNYKTLVYLYENRESIKNIDENLKRILLLFIDNLTLNEDFAVVNFAFDLFKKDWNYNKLNKKFESWEDLYNIIKFIIENYKNKVNSKFEIKEWDFDYYNNLIENKYINWEIIEEEWKKFLFVRNAFIYSVLDKEFNELLIKHPEFFWTEERYEKYKNTLNIKTENKYNWLLGIINNPNYISIYSMRLLDVLINKYLHIEEVKEYLEFIVNKNINELKWNYLWKGVLNEYSEKILNNINENNIWEKIKEIMEITIELEKEARG